METFLLDENTNRKYYRKQYEISSLNNKENSGVDFEVMKAFKLDSNEECWWCSIGLHDIFEMRFNCWTITAVINHG